MGRWRFPSEEAPIITERRIDAPDALVRGILIRVGDGHQLRSNGSEGFGRWGKVPEVRSRIMRSNRRPDTAPERAIRQAAHAAGLRYRVDYAIKPSRGRSLRPDLVFPKRKVAVFVDGCFWHECPEHGTLPARNRTYWRGKIAENVERDHRHNAILEDDGWTVVRIWEHEPVVKAISRIWRAVSPPMPREGTAEDG